METKFVTLVGVIPIYDNKILLTQRSLKSKFLPGAWGLPCGKIEYGEDLATAVFRELKEETGLTGRIIEMVGSSKFTGIKENVQLHNTQINFIVETDTANVVLDSSSENYKWINYLEVEHYNLDLFTVNTIKQAENYFASKFYASSFLIDLITSLDRLDWNDLPKTFDIIPKILQGCSSRIYELKQNLQSFPKEKYNNIIAFCHNLPSHNKWFLYKSKLYGYSIWINEYKEDRQYGYANTIHDHRYWFASLLLNGHFHQAIHDVVELKENKFTDISIIEEIHTSRGEVYSLSPDIVHSFPEIGEGTITLLVRSKAVKEFSTSYNVDLKTSTKHYSLKSKYKHFIELLK